MNIHTLNYDGYTIGDRLLEDVIFHVTIVEEGEKLTVGQFKPSPEAAAYLTRIRWDSFVPAMTAHIQGKIDSYLAWLAKENISLRQDLASFAAETGASEIDILNEL